MSEGGSTPADPKSVLTREAWEQARVVDEDLSYLIDEWRPEVDEPSLRRDSPLLRRLLIEGQYDRAWRDLGLPGEPYLSAPTLAAWLGQTTPAFVQYAVVPPSGRISATRTAQGGQVQMGVLQDVPTGSLVALAGAYGNGTGLLFVVVPPDEVARAEDSDKVVAQHLRPGHRQEIGLPLTRYLESPFAFVLGSEIPRRQVVQFVANKLGGALRSETRSPPRTPRPTRTDSHRGRRSSQDQCCLRRDAVNRGVPCQLRRRGPVPRHLPAHH